MNEKRDDEMPESSEKIQPDAENYPKGSEGVSEADDRDEFDDDEDDDDTIDEDDTNEEK